MARDFPGGTSTDVVGPALVGHSTAQAGDNSCAIFWIYPKGVGGGGRGRVFERALSPSGYRGMVCIESDGGAGFQLFAEMSYTGSNPHTTAPILLNEWSCWIMESAPAFNAINLYRATPTDPWPSLTTNITAGTGTPLSHDKLYIGNSAVSLNRCFHGTIAGVTLVQGLINDQVKHKAWRGHLFTREDGTASVYYQYPLTEPGVTAYDRSGRVQNSTAAIQGTTRLGGPGGRLFAFPTGAIHPTRTASAGSGIRFGGVIGDPLTMEATFGQTFFLEASIESPLEMEATFGTGAVETPTGWIVPTVQVDVVSGFEGYYYEVLVEVESANEAHAIDAIGLIPGAPPQGWSRGGISGQVLITLERREGDGPWRPVRRGVNRDVSNTTFERTIFDYEARSALTVEYRVKSKWTNADGDEAMTTSDVEETTLILADWWLKDPLEPELNIQIMASKLTVEREHFAESHQMIGRRLPVVTTAKNARTGIRAPLGIWVLTREQRDAIDTILDTSRVLMLQDHVGNKWYVRAIESESWERLRSPGALNPTQNADRHDVQVTFIEVEEP